jgi:soluble lytic murein transglycosylase-like protein
MTGNYSYVQAEPFKRVCKQGVIYYYFADQPNLNTFRPLGNDIMNQKPSHRPRGHIKVAPEALEPHIKSAGRNHKLPPALIKAVIRVESNFNPGATSPKGAQGLMQLMPGTAEDLQVADAYDAQENISGGSRYLGMLLKKFGFNLPMALAAYNAGPGRVERCRGVPNIPETQRFVRDVCASFLQYSGKPADLEKGGEGLRTCPK